ncbi:uncharacterized protein LOC108911607 isoform X2 [Anoplophora glabripennis]|uniref:uncharacterized protein LOC108911607 isoform X2 n=1 Tax=Anoplophora glabripennis TaxID=217634 RepID=UPI000874627C|nr:uncharacterized protein LOC108911607 isoform X2 [Anoplophora glabripennis]
MCSSGSCTTTFLEYGKAMSTETEGGFNEDSIQGLLNDTDSELSSLSHLDAPNESLYMIGGVCVAMFMVGVIIVLLAVTISKLRKREEHTNSVHPVTDVVLQTTPAATHISAAIQPPPPPQVLQSDLTYRGQFLWTQPPPPTTQYLYNHDQDTLVQNLPAERPGFVRGFRKNLGGRWRRLVKRKPPTEVYTIPAELKPQLKQIYVY